MSNDSRNGANGVGGPHDNGDQYSGTEWWDVPEAENSSVPPTAAGADSSQDYSSENSGVSDDTTQFAPQSGTEEPAKDVPPVISSEVEEDVDLAEEESSTGTNKHQILRWLGLAAALVVLLPVVIFGVSYAATKVPQPDELANDQISVIYDRTGQNELTRIVPEGGNRRNIELKDVPDAVRNAVLAAEDRNFYTNPGFSLSGYGRAAIGLITGNASAGGGSTITQQYVKNAVVGNERTLTRKAKELVMSAKMAREWSKDDILQAYLNTIYFGRNGYGIAAASEAYFGKDVSELSPAEGAVLAASIQRPSALDPWTNRAEAEQRWNYVLDGMVEMGVMSAGERASQVYPETIDPALAPQQAPEPGPAAMIKQQVLNELQDYDISEQDVNTRGLRITTTIDPEVQQSALDAMETYVDQSTGMRAAIVSVEPKTGAVRGYYGGDDPNGWDYANSGLQTGSTFKIFALAAALDQNIPLSAQYSSAPVQSGDATLYNAGGAGGGVVPISEALRQSLNTPFIRLQRDLKNGPDDTAKMAHQLGVAESIPGIEKTLVEDNGHTLDGITLGQYLTRPLDMAVGLATLTNDGVYEKTHFVEKVETVDGEVLYEKQQDEGERRVSKAVATNVIDAMKPIAAYSNHPLAGGRVSATKTGTTQLGDTGNNKDAWMIGSTPQLSTAVWVGNVDGSALFNQWGGIMYGANTPADLWKYTMDNALANKDFESFTAPEAIAGQAGAPAYQVYTPSTEDYTENSPEDANSETESPTSTSQAPSIPLPDAPSQEGPSLGDLLPLPGLGGNTGGGNTGGNTGGGNTGGNTGGGAAPAPAQGGGA